MRVAEWAAKDFQHKALIRDTPIGPILVAVFGSFGANGSRLGLGAQLVMHAGAMQCNARELQLVSVESFIGSNTSPASGRRGRFSWRSVGMLKTFFDVTIEVLMFSNYGSATLAI